MSPQEAAAWKSHTAASAHTWTVDPIHSTAEDLLVHIGGASGQYVEVHGAEVTVGNYEGAIPHIGEASFIRQGRKVFASNNDAIKFLVERGGIRMLTAVLGL